jgi:hypothetical protein
VLPVVDRRGDMNGEPGRPQEPDEQQPAHREPGLVPETDGPPLQPAPGPSGRAGLGIAPALPGDQHALGLLVVPGPPVCRRELVVRARRVVGHGPLEPRQPVAQVGPGVVHQLVVEAVDEESALGVPQQRGVAEGRHPRLGQPDRPAGRDGGLDDEVRGDEAVGVERVQGRRGRRAQPRVDEPGRLPRLHDPDAHAAGRDESAHAQQVLADGRRAEVQ